MSFLTHFLSHNEALLGLNPFKQGMSFLTKGTKVVFSPESGLNPFKQGMSFLTELRNALMKEDTVSKSLQAGHVISDKETF